MLRVYQLARALTATLIRGNEAIFARAQAHALSILSFETRLHIAIELPIQKYILNSQPWLMTILAKIYYSHIFVGVVFLVYMYAPPPKTLIHQTNQPPATPTSPPQPSAPSAAPSPPTMPSPSSSSPSTAAPRRACSRRNTASSTCCTPPSPTPAPRGPTTASS